LIIAFIFFALGIIVGIAAFKVLFTPIHGYNVHLHKICRKPLRNSVRKPKSSCLVPVLRVLLYSWPSHIICFASP